jgi:hypothetical protein
MLRLADLCWALTAIRKGRWKMARELFLAPLRQNRVAIAFFLSDTAAYIVSKGWDDVLASHIFRVAPEPYCGPCAPPPPLFVQMLYALVVLLTGTALQIAAEARLHKTVAATTRAMMGMLAGWSVGRVFQQLYDDLYFGPASVSTYARLLYALGVTIACALGIAGFIRATTPAQHALAVLLAQVEKASSMGVMLTWNVAITGYVTHGIIGPAAAGLKSRIYFFYALSATLGGAALAVTSSRVRRMMHDSRGGIQRTVVRVELLSLFESTLGFLAGCAWTDYFVSVSTLGGQPTLGIAAADLGESLMLTALAIVWVGSTSGEEREAVEENRPHAHSRSSGSLKARRATTADGLKMASGLEEVLEERER